jgi:hypothetical protein
MVRGLGPMVRGVVRGVVRDVETSKARSYAFSAIVDRRSAMFATLRMKESTHGP